MSRLENISKMWACIYVNQQMLNIIIISCDGSSGKEVSNTAALEKLDQLLGFRRWREEALSQDMLVSTEKYIKSMHLKGRQVYK